MTEKKALLVVLALLLLTLIFGFWSRKASAPAVRFSFEESPKKIFSDLKVAATKPQLARSPSGILSVLAVADFEKQRRLVYARSLDDGDHFSPAILVSDKKSSVVAAGENVPSLIQEERAIYAAWQETTSDGKHRIMSARSLDQGSSFERPIAVTRDSGTSFNGFSVMNVAPNGDIYVVWLDGRDQAQPEDTLAVYMAKSSDGGNSYGPNTRIALGACACCKPAIAFGRAGEVYVAWRKVFDGDVRDVVLAASGDGGKTFSVPKKVGEDQWVVHGCPGSGPSMASIGGRLYIAWFSEANHISGIRVSTSDDGGKNFTLPELASKGAFTANHPQLSISGDNHILLSFQGRRESKDREQWPPVQIFVTALDPLGRGSAPEPLPSVNHSAVYPSTLSAGPDRIFVAWTEVNDKSNSATLCRGIAH